MVWLSGGFLGRVPGSGLVLGFVRGPVIPWKALGGSHGTVLGSEDLGIGFVLGVLGVSRLFLGLVQLLETVSSM